MNATREKRPILAFTMGDVAGIGPEIIVRAWTDLCALCRPVIAGDGPILKRAMALLSLDGTALRSLESPLDAAGKPNQLDYCQVATADLRDTVPGRIGAAAGRAAHDFLVWAIDQAMARRVDGIVTAPLNKESLRAAGIQHPGHTEILADRTGTREFAMVLAIEGLAVIHQTLHMALRDVFNHLTPDSIASKAFLLEGLLRDLGVVNPRLGLAALNPHAGEHGLFGDEEEKILRPLVERLTAGGMNIRGPLPADTLFQRAVEIGRASCRERV